METQYLIFSHLPLTIYAILKNNKIMGLYDTMNPSQNMLLHPTNGFFTFKSQRIQKIVRTRSPVFYLSNTTELMSPQGEITIDGERPALTGGNNVKIYNINIKLQNKSILKGYFISDSTWYSYTNVRNFYYQTDKYMNSLVEDEANSFTNNVGTFILSRIPYLDSYNPYQIKLVVNENTAFLSYKTDSTSDWIDLNETFTCTCRTMEKIPPIHPISLFPNNTSYYYKPNSLSIGTSGVSNARYKKRRT